MCVCVDPRWMHRFRAAARQVAVPLAWAALVLAAPAALACRPMAPEDVLHQFVAVPPGPEGVGFSGHVVSVSTRKLPNGDMVTDTVLDRNDWKFGYVFGRATVRTYFTTRGPCGGGSFVEPNSVGQTWFVFGRLRRSIVETWIEPVGIWVLEGGRLPKVVERELAQTGWALGKGRPAHGNGGH